MKKIAFTLVLLLFGLGANSQVLITLLLGDKLNSDKIAFGLDGGLNLCDISHLEPAKMKPSFNLGFYFDFKLTTHLDLHTGVGVKSNMGADRLDPYLLDHPELDSIFDDGFVTRKIGYFQVPILLKFRFASIFNIEMGPTLSLRHKAFDTFTNTLIDKNDLNYKLDIQDRYKRIDFGIMLGAGMKLSRNIKSVETGVRYYFGLMDPLKDNPGKPQYNTSLYFYAMFPIGVSKDM